MALSLVCKECDTQLKSVQEAQAHNEATGHVSFEESSEAVSVVPRLEDDLHLLVLVATAPLWHCTSACGHQYVLCVSGAQSCVHKLRQAVQIRD